MDIRKGRARGGGGLPAYFSLGKHNIQSEDIVRLFLNCRPDVIREDVIVTPMWEQEFLAGAADMVTTVSEGHVYDVNYHDRTFTLIRSGMGAPQTGDVLLALGCTPCRHLIFTGSCGGLSDKMGIGALLAVPESIGGDGYSSYLQNGELSPKLFLMPANPNPALNELLEAYAADISAAEGVTLHKGKVFSSDSIVAELIHIDQIKERFGCIGVEMETSAVFNAAALTGIAAAALLIISDLPPKKTLFYGCEDCEKERYQRIKRSVLIKIILDTLCDERLADI